MSRLIALAGLALYTVQSRVDHDGKTYKPGEPIKLDTEAAQGLLDAQAIGHADQTGASALQASLADGQAQRVRALEDRLDRCEQQLQAARADLEAANASVTELNRAAASDLEAINRLQGEVTAAKESNIELQAQLDKATADLAAAQSTKAPPATKAK